MSPKRQLMAHVGYAVSERSCHGGRAWDWRRPNKGSMDSHHFASEELAWQDAERAFDREVERAAQVMAVVRPVTGVTVDTTIIAQALAEARAMARQAKAGMTKPVRRAASDLEVTLNNALAALKRIEERP